MIAHKISRVLADDPDFENHWKDIAGLRGGADRRDVEGRAGGGASRPTAGPHAAVVAAGSFLGDVTRHPDIGRVLVFLHRSAPSGDHAKGGEGAAQECQ